MVHALRSAALGAASLVALSMAAGEASAYSIFVHSSASAGGIYDGGGGTCLYNDSETGGACSGGTAHYGGSYTANIDPLGGPGTATYVTASESGAGAGASANSTTTVDLRTASLHLYGADSNVTSNCSTPLACGGTNNDAAFDDVLHFSVAGATASTVTPITLIFTLDGSMINTFTAIDSSAGGEIYGQMNFGASDARFDLISDASTGYETQVNYLDTYPSTYPGVWVTNAGHTSNVYTETYNLTGASDDIAIGLNAHLQCETGYICDFAHTAKFAFVLPNGTSFTSDSGVFLTGITGVPEPTGWALMITGMGLAGGAIRRRRTFATA